MNRQQKRAFHEFVSAWIRRLDRSIRLGERTGYVVSVP